MNSAKSVQYALMCLEALERHGSESLSAQAISREQGIPLPECQVILRCLEVAGIVVLSAQKYKLGRSTTELTALEVLQALWTLPAPEKAVPAFQLLYGPNRGTDFRRTLHAAGRIGAALPVVEG